MNPSSFSFDATALFDFSSILIKGSDAGNGVTLSVGDLYVWGLLGGGVLLVLGGLWMVRRMFVRVKFFALEYGEGGFFGRLKVIFPFIVLGAVMLLAGAAAAYLGWQTLGYSVTLNPSGLIEVTHGKTIRYTWEDAEEASDRIKSTEFGILFQKDGRKCRVVFQQRYIGEKLQDKAIEITEEALSSGHVRRTKSQSTIQ